MNVNAFIASNCAGAASFLLYSHWCETLLLFCHSYPILCFSPCFFEQYFKDGPKLMSRHSVFVHFFKFLSSFRLPSSTFFRVSSTSGSAKKASDANEYLSHKSRRSEGPEAMDWSIRTEIRSSVSAIQEITNDNALLQETGSIQKKRFDIQLLTSLCATCDTTQDLFLLTSLA